MLAVTIAGGQVAVRERPDPRPGAGEVLVRVMAAGLNGADQAQLTGRYPAPRGVPADIPGLGALPFEERAAQRATWWALTPETRVLTCSAEDLVVHKVFAGRDRDWLDVDGILTRQGSGLNAAQIDEELRPLLELKDAGHDLHRLQALMERKN